MTPAERVALRWRIASTPLAGKGILLERVGGLSPVRQTNEAAPEKRGVWAFIWPFAELFLLGSTSPEGITDGDKSRLVQLQREGFRKFVHRGKVWTRFHIPGAVTRNGWTLTDADTLAEVTRQHVHRAQDDIRAGGWPLGTGYSRVYSKDTFEVFVPRPSEGRVPSHMRDEEDPDDEGEWAHRKKFVPRPSRSSMRASDAQVQLAKSLLRRRGLPIPDCLSDMWDTDIVALIEGLREGKTPKWLDGCHYRF